MSRNEPTVTATKRTPPTEKTRLRDEARYLKKQIRQAESILAQRKSIKDLRAKLEDLQDRVRYPERYSYEDR